MADVIERTLTIGNSGDFIRHILWLRDDKTPKFQRFPELGTVGERANHEDLREVLSVHRRNSD